MKTAVRCTKCYLPLPEYLMGQSHIVCPACQASLEVVTFPAREISPIGSDEDNLLVEGESSCFYHVDRRAVVTCDECGRFLCSLCDLQLGKRHLCTSCFKPGDGSAEQSDLDSRRPLYDNRAILLALLPTGVTALISLYLAVKHWSRPLSLAPRSHVRWVIAVLLAITQLLLLGWWLVEELL